MALQNTDLFVVDRGGTNYKMAADQVTAKTGATGASIIPPGTTAERPAGVPGLLRWNNQLGYLEVYTGPTTGWEQLEYVLIPENLPNLTFSTSQTLTQAVYYCNNLTIDAGVILTLMTPAIIFYCSGNVQINGSINGDSVGGAGGAGITAFNRSIYETFSQFILGFGPGQQARSYSPLLYLTGSGGCSPFLAAGAGANVSSGFGGAGGGFIGIKSQGNITFGNAGELTVKGGIGVGWQIYNTGPAVMSGAGGGSGGGIILDAAGSITIPVGSIITADGGNGGNADGFGLPVRYPGGCGGGGGYVILQSRTSLTRPGTVSVNGGAAGGGYNGPNFDGGAANGGGYGGFGGVANPAPDNSANPGAVGVITTTGSIL